MSVRTKEQQLIDYCFEFAIKSAIHMHGKSNEEIAEWVRDNLRQVGFDTYQVGMSWGVLRT